MINIQNIQVKASNSFQTVCPFPVGYIYQSTNSTSPASIFGGTWTALNDGRFMRYSGSWNATGGESEHTLVSTELPRHCHAIPYLAAWGQSGNSGSLGWTYTVQNADSAGGYWNTYTRADVRDASTANGYGSAHNNLPPYRTCYAWHRTA